MQRTIGPARISFSILVMLFLIGNVAPVYGQSTRCSSPAFSDALEHVFSHTTPKAIAGFTTPKSVLAYLLPFSPDRQAVCCAASDSRHNPSRPAIHAGDYTPCAGGDVTLFTKAAAGSNTLYEWYRDEGCGKRIFAITARPEYLLQNVQPDHLVEYSVQVVKDQKRSGISEPLILQVSDITTQKPVISTARKVLCEQEDLRLYTSPITGRDVKYEWLFDNGDSVKSVALTSEPSLTIPDVTEAHAGIYSVFAYENACLTPLSNKISIVVNKQLESQPLLSISDPTPAPGTAFYLSATPYPDDNPVYQWIHISTTGGMKTIATTLDPFYEIFEAGSAQEGNYMVVARLGMCPEFNSNHVLMEIGSEKEELASGISNMKEFSEKLFGSIPGRFTHLNF